jgi:hypothetical protein
MRQYRVSLIVSYFVAHRYRSLRSFSRISHSGVYGGYLSSNRLTEIPLNTFDRLHLLPGSDKARLVEL